MRKLKLLMAACALMVGASQTWAQTDVTSTLLSNPDFSTGTAVTVGVCTYANDKSKNGTNYSSLVTVDGWTASTTADGRKILQDTNNSTNDFESTDELNPREYK